MREITSGAATRAVAPVPSPLTLVRFATAADDPSWARGASRRTPAGCEVPLFWRAAALIGCLVLAAGRSPVSGPAVELPPRLLDREFGRGRVTRFEDIDFPACLTHEPTRRFLRETGLPETAFPFLHDAEEIALPTLAEYYADPAVGQADRLIRLGRLADGHDVVVDGATGAVLTRHPADDSRRPLAPDVSALAFTLWLLHRAGPRGRS
ncbi:SUKH-4 family immunity protein [Streptomyces sp. HMX87]|uniref:SUKH-4 family immunity protein n=1 Tax=Streptomyces sp. HMX87 TaxID=3390849 RepID=UPI003A874928